VDFEGTMGDTIAPLASPDFSSRRIFLVDGRATVGEILRELVWPKSVCGMARSPGMRYIRVRATR